MARCPECTKFRNVESTGEYDQVDLSIDETGTVSAEYNITLECEECGTDMLTGTIVFEDNGPNPAIEEHLSALDTKIDECRDEAETNYIMGDGTGSLLEALEVAEATLFAKHTEEAIEAFLAAKEAAGWPRSQTEIECAEEIQRIRDEACLMAYDLEIEEQEVNIYGDTEGKRKIWVVEVVCFVKDNNHPEWAGAEVTLKGHIYQSEMDEA